MNLPAGTHHITKYRCYGIECDQKGTKPEPIDTGIRWRRSTKRCLKCAKTGHMIRECRNTKDGRDHPVEKLETLKQT